MRRQTHIAIALSTCALGLVFAGASRHLPYALPAVALAGLLLPALWRRLRAPGFDAHWLKVTCVTLLFWAALWGFFYAQVVAPPFADGVPVDDDYYSYDSAPAQPSSVTPPTEHVEWDLAEPCWFGAAASVSRDANVLWAGVIDRKARRKPQPFYPAAARAEGITGTVPVEVLVDGLGRVVVARPVGGHSLLRREAARAACNATFYPANVDGVPPLVSGLLNYDFGH